MKITAYKKKLFIYLFSIFLFFTVTIFVSVYLHEKDYRIETLNKELSEYIALTNNYIVKNHLSQDKSFNKIDSLTDLIPDKSLRISVIDLMGKVLFDSHIKNTTDLENHLTRPEIQKSIYQNYGADIRISHTTNIKYYYFAKKYSNYYIRISVVYDIEAKNLIEPDKLFLFFVILLFFSATITMIFITSKFGKTITTLKEFTVKASENKPFDEEFTFPDNELGTIGQKIIEIYTNLNNTKQELISEKEKLIRHLNLLEEGVAIFSKDKKVITNNSHFIQNINHVSDHLIYSADDFFDIQDFYSIFGFINMYISKESDTFTSQPSYEISLNKNGKNYTVKCIIFPDKSFEISITDTTKPAKLKMLKQQMTDNIAHELKTPVSSIKGFLETILNNPLIDSVKMLEFIRRAHSQSCRLTDLINDISLLTKIEEASGLYSIEKIKLRDLIQTVIEDVHLKLTENVINVELDIDKSLIIKGNQVLLYSVFRNLIDNAINYAGNHITIRIENYMEDSNSYYFSFSDTGTGVPEKDLTRLFERFYRVDKGRDRKTGGTGLGLAIVKNAILFHKGEISVKNKKAGGLEFLFSIGKEIEQL